jgi:hypothetical protein
VFRQTRLIRNGDRDKKRLTAKDAKKIREERKEQLECLGNVNITGTAERMLSDEKLAGELAEEFAFVHAVLEGFAAVDEDHGDFVGELATELFVGVDVDFLPPEQAAALELDEAFLYDFAEVAAFARVHQNVAGVGHQAGV